MKKLLFLVPMIVLLAVGCNSQQPTTQSNQPAANQPQAQVQAPPANQPTQVQPAAQGQVYENDYMKVIVPAGWTAKEANKTVDSGNCIGKTNCTPTAKSVPDPSSLNITKGNYILYINTLAGQASGVEGGRFEEYAGGAPSVDALITEHPGGPCGMAETSTITVNGVSYDRSDYYVGPSDQNQTCRKPTNGKTLWYFSDVGRGINYYNNPSNDGIGWVVTMAYNSKVVNSLPVKGSVALNAALDEMTGIVKTLEIKQR